jgi:type IV secretory pathway TrbF-like protein
MSNEFNEQSVNVKPSDAPVTPYQKAAGEWDRRIGLARVQAYNWRIIALSLCGLSSLLVIGLIYQSSKSTVTPYVVQVAKEGVVQAVGPAKQTNYSPGLPVIEYFLSQFIKSVRSIPMDPVVPLTR